MVPVGFIIFIQSIPSLTFRNVFQRPLPSKRDDDLDLHAVSQGGSPMADWFISWKIPSINGYPIGSMYAIDGNIYHQYTPVMLAYIYIYHTWILWDMISYGHDHVTCSSKRIQRRCRTTRVEP